MVKTTREERKLAREIQKAWDLIANDIGTQVLECVATNPGYVPTIRERKHAVALAVLGVRAWNPATGQNW